MRISDWSSDVCSSDLVLGRHGQVVDGVLETVLQSTERRSLGRNRGDCVIDQADRSAGIVHEGETAKAERRGAHLADGHGDRLARVGADLERAAAARAAGNGSGGREAGEGRENVGRTGRNRARLAVSSAEL